jgi:branched-chain amino acid transport system permease protein
MSLSDTIVQYILSGLTIGSIYALMAVGYSLVFSVLNFSNFAHGAIITLGDESGDIKIELLTV